MIEYSQNPIVRFLQKILQKMDKVSNWFDEQSKNAGIRIPTEPKVHSTKWDEYKEVASRKEEQQKSKFKDEVSNNGQYHTYGKNAMPHIGTMADPEKMKTIVNNMRKNDGAR